MGRGQGWAKGAGEACLLAVLGLFGPALASAENGAINIDVRFQEEHYRIENPGRQIVWDHHVAVTLSGRNAVQESWDHHSNAGLTRSGSNESTFGDAARPYVWHVLGSQKLVRVQTFLQHTMTITIETHPDKSCTARVDYRLKPGYSDMLVPRADNNVLAHFTLPRILQESCTIS